MLSSTFFRRLYFITVIIVAVVFGFIPNANSQVAAGQEEAENMQLVGYNDLQGRSAYQPSSQQQGDRWYADIGHHSGIAQNPLAGREEGNGTSIVDVTDPANPE